MVKEERRKEHSPERIASRTAQAAVNALRKAELKVARLAKDRTEKAARFATYEREIRASFAAEEKRYHALQEKLTEEHAEAVRQLQAAKEIMANTAAEFREGAMETEETAAGSDQWDRMVRRVEPPAQHQDLDPELIEILRRYKRGETLPSKHLPSFGAGETGQPGEGLPAREKPTRERTSPILATPKTSAEKVHRGGSYGAISPSLEVRAEPYPASSPTLPHPKDNTVETQNISTGPSATTSAEESRLPKRAPTKANSKAMSGKPDAGSLSFQEKVEQKRMAMRGNAMEPFRRTPPGATEAVVLEARTESPGPQPGMEHRIESDDGEELNRSHSPGLGRLDG